MNEVDRCYVCGEAEDGECDLYCFAVCSNHVRWFQQTEEVYQGSGGALLTQARATGRGLPW